MSSLRDAQHRFTNSTYPDQVCPGCRNQEFSNKPALSVPVEAQERLEVLTAAVATLQKALVDERNLWKDALERERQEREKQTSILRTALRPFFQTEGGMQERLTYLENGLDLRPSQRQMQKRSKSVHDAPAASSVLPQTTPVIAIALAATSAGPSRAPSDSLRHSSVCTEVSKFSCPEAGPEPRGTPCEARSSGFLELDLLGTTQSSSKFGRPRYGHLYSRKRRYSGTLIPLQVLANASVNRQAAY